MLLIDYFVQKVNKSVKVYIIRALKLSGRETVAKILALSPLSRLFFTDDDYNNKAKTTTLGLSNTSNVTVIDNRSITDKEIVINNHRNEIGLRLAVADARNSGDDGEPPDRQHQQQGIMGTDDNHDEVHMTTPELITKHGYIAETHHVWTEDGYRLELHRVVRKAKKRTINGFTGVKVDKNPENNESCKENNSDSIVEEILNSHTKEDGSPVVKPPILVNHGLLSSSADWVLLGPEKALAYVLCDSGFDVWLANVRGNTYSQCHKKYTTKNREFWDFSWHEIGYYDLPAMIDYILDKTQQTSLHYVGYSQGTTTFYVMCSERPEYCEKVKGMVSMAPVAFLTNQRSPLIKFIVRFYIFMEWGSLYCNINQWFPRSKLQAKALSTLVRNTPGTLTKSFYSCWFYLIAGFGSNQLDKSMLPLIFGHFPGGSSAKQIIHYSQIIINDSFRKFDYGTSKNLKLYGSTQPPKYCLERVTVPVAVFYSENDFLTHPTDVKRLVENIPNVVLKHKIEYSKFNHIDYLWGRDAKTLLYDHIIDFIKAYD